MLKLFCASSFHTGYDSYTTFIVAVNEFNDIEPLLLKEGFHWDMITKVYEVGIARPEIEEPCIVHSINNAK